MPLDIEAMAGLAIDLGNKVTRIHDRVTRVNPKPIRKPVGTSFVQSPSAPSPVLIKIQDTPAVGRMWFVKKIGIFGTDGHTSVANAIVDVYAGAEMDTGGGTPISDFSAQIVTGASGNVPSITRFGRFDQPISAHEYIYAYAYAVPANQAIELVCEVDEWKVEDQEAIAI